VKAAAAALADVTPDDLRSVFDPAAMMHPPDPNMEVYGAFSGPVYDVERGGLVVCGRRRTTSRGTSATSRRSEHSTPTPRLP
jgi:hypothetical protein